MRVVRPAVLPWPPRYTTPSTLSLSVYPLLCDGLVDDDATVVGSAWAKMTVGKDGGFTLLGWVEGGSGSRVGEAGRVWSSRSPVLPSVPLVPAGLAWS